MSASLSGERLERKLSAEFHSQGIPFLVSPDVLRSRGLGQLDILRLKKKADWIVEIAEVKSSHIGEEQYLRGQRRRIVSAGAFLSSILGFAVRIIRLIE